MSNLPSPPDSRRLEQLKVAELRDELRKRGFSLKGVKKELIERLEEAIKQDEKDGFADLKHQEGASKTDAADEPEEFEGAEESLDGGKEELSKISNSSESQDTPDERPSSTSPSASVLTSKGTTPFQESQALSVVSAPDGVPGVSEDREECSTAGNLETNNSVLFVNNAACENGDADLLPENVPDIEFSLANASEPGNGTADSVCDTGHMENQESFPNNVMPEVAANKNVDVLHESSVLNETSVSVVTPFENAEAHDDEVNVVPDGKEILEDQQSKLETSENMLSESVVQISIQAPAPSNAVMTEIVNEPSGESKSDDVVKPVTDEIDTTINEAKPGVQVEGLEKCISIDVAKTGKTQVKVEPMEIDICAESIPDIPSETGQELQIFEKDLQQQKSPFDAAQLKVEPDLSNNDNVWKSQGGEIVSGVPGVAGKDAKDVVDLKPAEDVLQDHTHLKRSSEPKQQEPAKRMRRWNSGNRVAVDTLKPLTSGNVKEIMLSESTDGSSVVAQRVSQKVVATSRSLPPKVKAESEPSSNTRTVPPSARAPSNSLKIERFVRPFTLKAVKDLLAEFGECTDFWMDQIKTHCFVSFSSVDEAVAARNGLYGRQWPPSVGNFLTADHVDSNEVKIRLEGLPEKAEAAPAAPPSRIPDPIQAPLRVSQPPSSFRSDSTNLPLPRFSRGGQFPPVPPEPAVPTLEDLFFKTKEKPHIYYLPLTDEQVAEKIKSKHAFM